MINFLRGLPPVFLSLILFSCASQPKLTSISPEIQEDINQVERSLIVKKKKGHHLLSPGHYSKSENELKEAKKIAMEGASRQKIYEHLDNARFQMRKMDQPVSMAQVHLSDVLKARQSAISKGASGSKKFKKADDQLSELGEELEEQDINEVLTERQDVLNMYVDAEVNALQGRYLAEARNNLKKSKDMEGADSYDDSQEEVKKKINTAENLIRRHRHIPSNFHPAVVDATIASRRLLARVETASWIENTSTREIVDRLESDFQRIAAPMAQVDSTMLNYRNKVNLVTNQSMDTLSRMRSRTSELRQMDQVNEQFSDVRDRFNEEEAQIFRQGQDMIIRLTGLSFAFDSAKIPNKAKPLLDTIGNRIKRMGNKLVQISGHTDSIGDADYNQRLSEKRANSVKQYLVDEVGLNSNNISAIGFGYNQPITDNESMAARRENRRIDITIFGVEAGQELAE